VRVTWRAVTPVAAAVAVLGTAGYFWLDSLVPATYDMTAVGYPDGGGRAGGHVHGGGTSVTDLTGPTTGRPDVAVTLTARREAVTLPGGARFAGYTLNHTSPGPEIHARQGQLVQVTLVNDNVPHGVTLHWHGVDVPNAEDGVAGVTQDAVRPGHSHVYRFVAQDAGTYWYHSHQDGYDQVRLGLYGILVVAPRAPLADAVDTVAAVHTYDGRRTLGGRAGVTAVAAAPGDRVRVRLANTDAGPIRAWVSGTAYRVAAVDGRDLHDPPPVAGEAVLVTAGGRVDLELTVPAAGAARVDVGAGTALVVGPSGATAAATPEPRGAVDLLSYGTPAPLGFDPARAGRVFRYALGRRIGFLDGRPGLWWTVNGHLWPDVPMFVVSTGDVVRMTVSNSSGEVHPMHLHGHHAVVLSRDGVRATGSPWWVDSLDVGNGQTYEIAFIADNPGIWVDHCHNLKHAADGLLAHLAYTGVGTPYRVGGKAGNRPE
jgi:FtsP/CotA-like multicopper oxidase with cupredoxin domain